MNTLTTRTKTTSFPWLAAWIVASAIGITLGFLGTLPLLWNMTENVSSSLPMILVGPLGGAFFGFGIGLATGLAQWLVLRLRGESGTRWIIGSLVGGIVGGIITVSLSVAVNDGGENSLLTVLVFALLGAILGGGQYFAAHSTVHNAGWIVVSAVALGAGAALPFVANDLEIVGVVAGGLIYGIVTAAALWWFARQ